METRSDTTMRTNSSGLLWLSHPQLSPSAYTFDKPLESKTAVARSQCSSNLSSDVSSEPLDSGLVIKVGRTLPGRGPMHSIASLADVMQMKVAGKSSIGSLHDGADHSQCVPCTFHFAHLQNARRPPCKASYFCEFCHSENRPMTWRRPRAQRKPKNRPLHDGSIWN